MINIYSGTDSLEELIPVYNDAVYSIFRESYWEVDL
jgi:hypothetical protein